MEGCRSGLTERFAKPSGSNTSRMGSNPIPSARQFSISFDILKLFMGMGFEPGKGRLDSESPQTR